MFVLYDSFPWLTAARTVRLCRPLTASNSRHCIMVLVRLNKNISGIHGPTKWPQWQPQSITFFSWGGMPPDPSRFCVLTHTLPWPHHFQNASSASAYSYLHFTLSRTFQLQGLDCVCVIHVIRMCSLLARAAWQNNLSYYVVVRSVVYMAFLC